MDAEENNLEEQQAKTMLTGTITDLHNYGETQ